MDRARVNVKVAPAVDVEKILGSIREISGVAAVVHTFQEEDDDELKRLAIVEVEPTCIDAVLRVLESNPDLEYVAIVPQRGLRRSP